MGILSYLFKTQSQVNSDAYKKMYQTQEEDVKQFLEQMEKNEIQWWMRNKDRLLLEYLKEVGNQEREKLESLDNPQALFAVAKQYFQGINVKKNISQSFAWFRGAAINGHVMGALYASCYYRGEAGYPKHPYTSIDDERREIFYMFKAAYGGEAQAQVRIGMYYDNGGTILGQNSYAAVLWYEKASALNNPDALCFLGDKYREGDGVKKSIDKAYDYYMRAAKLGEVDSMYNLGILLHGDMNPSYYTPNEAGYWFNEAAKRGHLGAKDALNSYYRQRGNTWYRIDK